MSADVELPIISFMTGLQTTLKNIGSSLRWMAGVARGSDQSARRNGFNTSDGTRSCRPLCIFLHGSLRDDPHDLIGLLD